MPAFSVDPAALRSTAAKLSDASAEYERIYKQLIQTATTMGSAYESADNKRYVERIESCCKALQAMADKLRLASEAIRKDAENYSTTEDHNLQQAGRLGGF